MDFKLLSFYIRNISLIKTFRFNVKYFHLSTALVFPVIVSRRTKFVQLKGKVFLSMNHIEPAIIKIGFGNVPFFDRRFSRTIWNNSGHIIFHGKASIGHGSKIGCGGRISFGNNFQITAESTIICDKEITFSDDVLLSWQVQIMDTDFHKVLINDSIKPHLAKISIGKHVWIGNRVTINKGVTIEDNSIIASGSVVTKSFSTSNVLIGGVPAKIIRAQINWEN